MNILKNITTPVALFLGWFGAWACIGVGVGIIVNGHAWILMPIAFLVYGSIGGTIWTLLMTRVRPITRVSSRQAVGYGVIAGAVSVPIIYPILHSLGWWIAIFVVDGVLALLLFWIGKVFYTRAHGGLR